MEQTYEFANLIIAIAALAVGTFSAYFALKQLRHARLTRDVDFMRGFDENLITKEHREIRLMIYNTVPHPYVEQ